MSINIIGKYGGGDINMSAASSIAQKAAQSISGSAPSVSFNSGGGGGGGAAAFLSLLSGLMALGSSGSGSNANNLNLIAANDVSVSLTTSDDTGITSSLFMANTGVTMNGASMAFQADGGYSITVANNVLALSNAAFSVTVGSTVLLVSNTSVSTNGSMSVGASGNNGKLFVSGTSGATVGSYGYYPDTALPGTTSGTVAYSIYATDRIGTGTQFDAHSDRRLKHDITPIALDDALRFVEKVEPVSFHWNEGDPGLKYGFIAQDILRAGFPHLINASSNLLLQREVEADGLVSPDGAALTLSYDSVIPILAAALRHALQRIDELERERHIPGAVFKHK